MSHLSATMELTPYGMFVSDYDYGLLVCRRINCFAPTDLQIHLGPYEALWVKSFVSHHSLHLHVRTGCLGSSLAFS